MPQHLTRPSTSSPTAPSAAPGARTAGTLLALALGLVVAIPSAAAKPRRPPPDRPAGAIRAPAAAITFGPGKAPFPAAVQVAILEGDPAGPGNFTARVKFPDGAAIAPHTHGVPERTTVLAGAVWVGFGKIADHAHAEKLEAGSFYVNPPGVVHFVMAEGETVLQISTEGPWDVTPAR
jgi:quercetin dioxygenase-like cupin family protein